MNKQQLFETAPRRTGEVTINGHTVEIKALSMSARLSIAPDKSQDAGDRMAWVCTQGCDALADSTADEVTENLDPDAIGSIFKEIMDLSAMGSEEEEAEKKSESNPS